MMRKERTTAPASDFITVAEAARNVFGDETFDSVKLTRDIKAVIANAEQYCERAFINQVWTFTLDAFPATKDINPDQAIYIPYGKLQSIDSFNYYDGDGNTQSLVEDTDYHVDTFGDHSRLVPTEAADGWPDTYGYRPNTITIVATLGYGTSLPTDKNDIKDACLLRLGDLYEFRQSKIVSRGDQVADSGLWKEMLSPYKIYFDFDLYNA